MIQNKYLHLLYFCSHIRIGLLVAPILNLQKYSLGNENFNLTLWIFYRMTLVGTVDLNEIIIENDFYWSIFTFNYIREKKKKMSISDNYRRVPSGKTTVLITIH